MRVRTTLGLVAAVCSFAASAATIIVYTDPMTLQQRTVVFESDGPDRAFHCMLPPSDAGCRALPLKRDHSR